MHGKFHAKLIDGRERSKMKSSTTPSYTSYQYGKQRRQTVGVWILANAPNDGRWVVFIHGGAWRDPSNTLLDFAPSITSILSLPPKTLSQICGCASIDYRLSPQTGKLGDNVDWIEAQMVRHPGHILDVRAALTFLHQRFNLGSNYVLIGHSVGATMAYQVLMGDAALSDQRASSLIPLPAAVIGISGIYDIGRLVDTHTSNPVYRDFVTYALGENEVDWAQASPARFQDSYTSSWSGFSILAHSPEDSLVDAVQTDVMAVKLQEDGLQAEVVRDLVGEHDLVWQEGIQIAHLIERVLERLGQGTI